VSCQHLFMSGGGMHPPLCPRLVLTWAWKKGQKGLCPNWILKFGIFYDLFAKKIVFFVSRGKNKISPHLPPLRQKSFRRPWGEDFSLLYTAIWYFLIKVLVDKCFSVGFELIKWKLTTVVLLKIILATLWKVSFRRLCVVF